MSLPLVISIFAGCGGSSLGYKWAGFKELLAIDFDKNSVETFALNFPEVPVWQKDIKEVTGKEILDFCKIVKGELDVFDGSPPCQGFSTAGKRNVSDSRNNLFKEYTRLLKELQPKVFVMENVSGMAKGTMKGRFLEILAELKQCGYNVKCKLMNAMWYNVPQSRERLIFIGTRNDLNIDPVFPEPNKRFIPVKEAWLNLPKSQTHTNFNGRKIRKGFTMANLSDKIKPGRTATDILGLGKGTSIKKLNYFKPSQTIERDTGSIHLHPFENRSITIEEMKRVSSFPDDFTFKGTTANAQNRLGNSVPPKMMQAIAETIKNKILNKIAEYQLTT